MKLRSLTLENVRKFAGKSVTLDGVGDGITVVSEANEFGKSTFFDALHALFFEKYGATARGVKSLQPHSGGGVRIAAEVETADGLFRVEKRFLSRKGASVTALPGDRQVARDDEAEAWIAAALGQGEHGPAGLLWVRQGVTGLEPPDGSRGEKEKLAEARRDLLSSVAGEIEQVTGGRRMDRILRRCEEDLDRIATSTGRPRANGPWKEAEDRAAALETELQELEGQCAELSEALEERSRVTRELARLDDPGQKARREADLARAREEARAARDHARKVEAAARELEIAELQRTGADAALKTLRDDRQALEEARETAREAATRHAEAVQGHEEAAKAEAGARAGVEAAEARLRAVHAERKQAEAQGARRRARDEAGRLRETLERLRERDAERRAARLRLEANPADAAALARAEEAVAECDRLAAALAAREAWIEVTYRGGARLSRDGQALPGGTRIALGQETVIDIPGVGDLRIGLPRDADAEGLEARLAAARAARETALAACGVADLTGARDAARARQEDADAARLADETIRTLAPQGMAALEEALERADALAATGDAATAGGDMGGGDMGAAAPRPLDEIRPELDAIEVELADLRARQQSRAEVASRAAAELARRETALDAAKAERDRAEGRLGPEAEREARAARADARARDAARAAREKADAVQELRAAAPDPETAEANLKRAEGAAEAARQGRARLAERRAELSAHIEARAEAGVEERRDETRGALAAARDRVARFRREAEVLTRLRTELQAARRAAREAYFEPVQQELQPLLRILHEDAGLDWESDTIKPGALRRGGAVEAFETLSGGTQEQIAILTRLAFARLFARRGQHLPIILDDALVYSDDDRIVKMFTALNRVAADQQILVFSCRQMAFAGLGGARPEIRVSALD